MYGNLVWHFCPKKSALKIEKVNRKALRTIVNDYTLSYADPLYNGTMSAVCVTAEIDGYWNVKSMTHSSPTFIKKPFYYVRYPVWFTWRQIYNSAICWDDHIRFRYEWELWNNLPSLIKCASSVNDFKVLVKQWTGPPWHCGSCVSCDIDQLWAAIRHAC